MFCHDYLVSGRAIFQRFALFCFALLSTYLLLPSWKYSLVIIVLALFSSVAVLLRYVVFLGTWILFYFLLKNYIFISPLNQGYILLLLWCFSLYFAHKRGYLIVLQYSSYPSFLVWSSTVLYASAFVLFGFCCFRGVSFFYLGYGVLLFLYARLIDSLSLRTFLSRSISLAFFLILPLLIFEICTFFILPFPRYSWARYDPIMLFSLSSNDFIEDTFMGNSGELITWNMTTSTLGIRDREFDKKKENEFRIVTIGDSFTMGQALQEENTYQRLLEKLLLEKKCDKTISVINCGIVAFAPWQERLFLQKIGFELEPDMVVLQLFPPNDVEGDYLGKELLLPCFNLPMVRKITRFRYNHQIPYAFERWIWQHSLIYRTWCERTNQKGYISDLLGNLRFLPFSVYKLPTSTVDRDPHLEPCLRDWYPELEEAWALYANSIRGIQEDCQDYGVPLVAFTHGMRGSLQPDFWEKLNRDNPNTPYEMNKDVRLTQELFVEFGIPYVDITAAFMAHPERNDLYHLYEGHFSDKGAKVVASTLADFLLEHYLRDALHCGQEAPHGEGI